MTSNSVKIPDKNCNIFVPVMAAYDIRHDSCMTWLCLYGEKGFN